MFHSESDMPIDEHVEHVSSPFWCRLRVAVFVFLAVIINLGVLLAYHYRETPADVYLDGVSVGELRMEEVVSLVRDVIKDYESLPFQFVVGGEKAFLTAADVGVHYDYRRTVRNIFDIDGGWGSKDAHAVQGTHSRNLKPYYTWDRGLMKSKIRDILSARNEESVDAQVVWMQDKGWFIVPEQNGRHMTESEVDRLADLMEGEIVNRLDRRLLTAHYKSVEAARKVINVEPLLEKILAFVAEPVQVDAGGVMYELDLSVDGAFVVFEYDDELVSVSGEKVGEWAEYFAEEVYVEPGTMTITGTVNVESDYNGASVRKITYEGDVIPGREIDSVLLDKKLKEMFANKSERKIDIEFSAVPPVVVSLMAGLEFPELLSTGRSSYHLGNYPNRVHNIHKGLELINGRVLYPGDEFSFNETAGWITKSKGFVNGKAIFGDRIGDSIGGGICQVSTTIYRAALNAGFKITEQRPHSWYIDYYTAYGDGLDATIYPPGARGNNDFQFSYNADPEDIRLVQDGINPEYTLAASVLDKGALSGRDAVVASETKQYPLLVLAAPDVEAEEALVWFFGTSDGRQVNMEKIGETHVGRKRTKSWVRVIDGVREEIVSEYRR